VRKACLISAIVLLCATWVVAQSSTSTSATDHNANKTTMQGCLAGSAGNYTLTETSGKEYQLRGDSSRLAEHVNQEVKVMGHEQSMSNSSTSTSTSTTSSSTTSNPSFHVTSVEKVADTCSTAGK
jgi:hypothetical protein